MWKVWKLFFVVIIAVVGLALLIIPGTSGQDAYFVGDKFFINMVDSVDAGYEPYVLEQATAERNTLAAKEKATFRSDSTLKAKGDSLDKALATATLRRDEEGQKAVIKAKKALEAEIFTKELAIEEKYALENLSEADQATLIENLKSTITKEVYLVALANEMIREEYGSKSKKAEFADIKIKEVNKQDGQPFYIAGLVLILIAVFIQLADGAAFPLHNTGVKIGFGAIVFAGVITLGLSLYYNFANAIEFQETLEERTKVVTDHLDDIKTIQLAHLEEKGKYAKTWQALKSFAENDSVTLTKFLVNKDDTAAVNYAKRNNLPLEETSRVAVLENCFPNRKFDISKLGIVPFSKDTFFLDAAEIDRNGRMIQVFEINTDKYTYVKELDILPENFDKEQKLILGSMQEPSTEGNW